MDRPWGVGQYGNFENPFNLPYLASSSGAVYVAHWTSLDARRVKEAMVEALRRTGLSLVKIISPCPTNCGRRNRIGDGLDELRYYQENTVIRHGSDPKHADLGPGKEVTAGCFLDEPRPTYLDLYNEPVVDKGKLERPST